MHDECSLQKINHSNTLAVRFRCTESEIPVHMHSMMPRLMAYMQQKGIQPTGYTYLCFHDVNTAIWDIEAGFPIKNPHAGEGEFFGSQLPSCLAATTMHKGSYKDLGKVYSRLIKWIEANHYQITGCLYEIAMNNPTITPLEELHTGLMIPVQIR